MKKLKVSSATFKHTRNSTSNISRHNYFKGKKHTTIESKKFLAHFLMLYSVRTFLLDKNQTHALTIYVPFIWGFSLFLITVEALVSDHLGN